ncbi:MAG: IS5 family transposase [Ferrovum sp.]|nr:IS5 family transposase [Ferrovum sp.]
MKPKMQAHSASDDLFRMRLEQMLDQRHPLYRLAGKVAWAAVEERFGGLYAEEGRHGIPIRLMVGLHYLKHAFNESDETVVERWVENPYWQYFCGEEYFRHEMPINPSQMTRFRDRIGEAGCEFMLGTTVLAGIETKTVSRASLAVVNVDTTVQDKAIAFPTDARLYHKARGALVRMAKRHGVELRQNYERLSKRALMMNGRYAHARQMQRARREQKRPRTYLGRVIRDIDRKLSSTAEDHKFNRLLEIAKRIHAQQRHDKGKVYSVHAPEVECIAKGKAHKPYEFGVKVGVVSTSKESFVVGMKSLPGNPYDGHTLQASLEQTQRLTGIAPKEAYVDRGYRGHGIMHEARVWIAGAKRGVTVAIHRKLKRRNAVEPVIGHMKNDGRLGRNFLKGIAGDAMNALLCGAGHNLRKILRRLALLCARFAISLKQLLDRMTPNLRLVG